MPIFIDRGAPFAYKTTNISVLDLFARDGGLQDISAADDPDGLIIDFDRVDDRTDIALAGIGVRVLAAVAAITTVGVEAIIAVDG